MVHATQDYGQKQRGEKTVGGSGVQWTLIASSATVRMAVLEDPGSVQMNSSTAGQQITLNLQQTREASQRVYCRQNLGGSGVSRDFPVNRQLISASHGGKRTLSRNEDLFATLLVSSSIVGSALSGEGPLCLSALCASATDQMSSDPRHGREIGRNGMAGTNWELDG